MVRQFILCLALCFIAWEVQAGTLKIGVLAPDGTTWAKYLKQMSKEVKKKTDGKVKFKVYLGGSQGDEREVLRKIRVGQLHAGMFSGKTLGDINGDLRVMEIPFTFHNDRAKAWSTLEKLQGYFNKGFEAKGFKNLGYFELGLVYYVSKKPAQSLADLSGVKIWAWEGDPLVASLVDTMGLVSVPLPLPDVLSSLSTGIIEGAYSSAMPIIALQWNTKIKYLVEFPISFATGAFLIEKRAWDKAVPEKYRPIVEKICSEYFAKVNASTISENASALEAMKSMGIQFLNFPKEDLAKGAKLREEMVKKLKGKLFSDEAYNKLKTLL